jgi:hypothetical protein
MTDAAAKAVQQLQEVSNNGVKDLAARDEEIAKVRHSG